MTTSMLPEDLEIAPGYTVACWKNLDLDPDLPRSDDWKKAIRIFDTRIRCRFFNPVDELLEIEKRKSQKTFGFAILAIDFLVLETLEGFREGETNHKGKSKRLFTDFLKQWDTFTKCLPANGKPERYACKIYKAYRCALHHSGATDGAFRVGVSGPVFDFKTDHEVKINRTCFHRTLKCEFERYVRQLDAPDNQVLRENFKKKMDAICGLTENI